MYFWILKKITSSGSDASMLAAVKSGQDVYKRQMLVCARLRHVDGTQWGNKKYMNMKHLEAAIEDASIAG